MIRDAQRDPEVFDNIIDSAAEVLVEACQGEQGRTSGSSPENASVGQRSCARRSVTSSDLFVSELAVVLARLPNIENWASEDVTMVSRLFVRNMVSNAEEVVEMPDGRPDLEEQIKEGARRQMRSDRRSAFATGAAEPCPRLTELLGAVCVLRGGGKAIEGQLEHVVAEFVLELLEESQGRP